MLIVRGNLKARLARSTTAERLWLEQYLSFPDRRFHKRRERGPDGEAPRLSMLSAVDGTFAAGFVPLVERAGAAAGHQVSVLDKRALPCWPDPKADLEWLRHHPATSQPITHQVDAVEAVVIHKRGIVWAATGGGKTEVAIGLARRLPCRWLMIVHRSGLMRQAAERYELRTGQKAGTVGDEEFSPHWPFTVATFQTLHAGLKKGDARFSTLLKEAQGIVCDEAHVVAAETFLAVAMATPNAYFRVGLSATPLARGDQKSVLVIGALGPVILRVKPAELEALGILATGTIRMVELEQYAGTDDYREAYRELVVESAARNALLVKIAKKAPKPCLLFVREIDHGKELERGLRLAGVATEFVWGSDSTAERAAAIRRLERGDVEVVVCSVVFQEGIDIPTLASGVNGAAGASAIAAIQRLGRTSRATEGKRSFEFWDVLDKGDRHLAKHARARMRSYVGEGHKVSIVKMSDL